MRDRGLGAFERPRRIAVGGDDAGERDRYLGFRDASAKFGRAHESAFQSFARRVRVAGFKVGKRE